MQFEKNEFKGILRRVRDQFEYGAKDVFFVDGKIGKDDLHFTYNWDEIQWLYQENHFESDKYVNWDVRSFYEALVMIDNGKLPAGEYLYSNSKTLKMEDKPIAFAEGQLRRVGMAEAMTPELRDKMKQKPPFLDHSFSKEYGNDKVNVTLHFKKSTYSDNMFLNKYDMELTRAGQTNPIKQTFYVPPQVNVETTDSGKQVRHDNKYTMKEGYNLLSGRPVLKNLVSKDGASYQAWVKLDRKNVLANGNHELKQYNENYGFSLQEVLKQYPIKELTNEQYSKNLLDSLQRGNLQKVTFVGKEGKEQSLYISPSITTSSLNVFDTGGKRVPLEKLVNDGHISEGLVQNLKEKFGQKQDQGLGAVQTPPGKEVQKQEQTPAQGEKQNKRQRRRQKM